MSDDERIARLTDLARRVWPDADVGVSADAYAGLVVNHRPHANLDLALVKHPRSLDALEAALLVLNGQVSDALVGLAGETVLAIEAKYRARAFAWVEELAAEWEARAARMVEGDAAVERCAAELRARAKASEHG